MKRKMRKKNHPPGKDLALAHRTVAGELPTHGLTKMLQLLTELESEWESFLMELNTQSSRDSQLPGRKV